MIASVLLTPSLSSFSWEIDESGNASDLSGAAGLSAIAAPILLSAGVVTLGTTGLSASLELSDAVVDSAASEPCRTNCVIVEKKSIPFVVREDYVQFNQKAGQ